MIYSVDKEVKNEVAFTVTTDLTTISGTNETPLLILKNPSCNTLKLMITHVLIGTDSASTRSVYRIYANPTITDNGTQLTPINTYIKSNPQSSTAETYKLPTISSNGSVLNMAIATANSNSRGINRFYWIDPGNSILITVQNSSGNAKTFSDIYWLEGN